MKKKVLLIFVTGLMALASLSYAESPIPVTREESIYLEGVEETITTTRFESQRGYSLWIDTDYLTLQPEGEGNDIDEFLRPDTEDRRYLVAINYDGVLGYTFEEAAESALQVLTDNHAGAEEFDIEGTFTGLTARGFCATDGDMTFLKYVVDAGEGAFYIYITFPREAAEGFGSRAIQMLKSFEILARDDADMIE